MALSPAVANLMEEYKRFNATTMNELFASDSKRAEKYTIEFENLTFDYSKNRFDDKVLSVCSISIGPQIGIGTAVLHSVCTIVLGHICAAC